uniref:Uncharacterized protein n=1 Tax=Anopheles atroparvus TaxID=41427 RepID=A0A182IMQ0_ANOAO
MDGWINVEDLEYYECLDTLVCDFCYKGYQHKASLAAHIATKHAEDSQSFQCDKCGLGTFKNMRQLKAHERSHIRKECVVCKKLLSSGSLMKHLRTHAHPDCGTCRQHKHAKNLTKHILLAHLPAEIIVIN